MTLPSQLKTRILNKLRHLLPVHRSDTPLRVAVLGPNLGESSNPGGEKRRQIYQALREAEHSPFFPESILEDEPATSFFLGRERELLASSDVHLVFLLHTSGYGVVAELGSFVHVPEIVSKTIVLYPYSRYQPTEALLANTAREFPFRMPYSQEQFDSCNLVAECLKWAEQRRSGTWPSSAPHSF